MLPIELSAASGLNKAERTWIHCWRARRLETWLSLNHSVLPLRLWWTWTMLWESSEKWIVSRQKTFEELTFYLFLYMDNMASRHYMINVLYHVDALQAAMVSEMQRYKRIEHQVFCPFWLSSSPSIRLLSMSIIGNKMCYHSKLRNKKERGRDREGWEGERGVSEGERGREVVREGGSGEEIERKRDAIEKVRRCDREWQRVAKKKRESEKLSFQVCLYS